MDFDAFFGHLSFMGYVWGYMICQDVCMEVKEQLAEDDFLVDYANFRSHTC